MNHAQVMLAGVPLAGAPSQRYASEQGRSRVRLSQGALFSMSHWKKEQITLSGGGDVPHGLDGLDYTAPMELRCTHPKSITGRTPADRAFTPSSAVRPDVSPWGWALLDGRWLLVPASLQGGQIVVEAVPGAERYRGLWMPVFNVICDEPEEVMDARYDWQLTAWEV